MIEIYYSNSLLDNNSSCLDELDVSIAFNYRYSFNKAIITNLKNKTQTYSFKKGFEQKLFFNINSKRKKKITDIRFKYKRSKPLMNNFERIVSIWKS
jgi:hypothetical protein